MSYIQIDLGGKLRGLKFNQLAIEVIGTHNDTTTNTGFLYAMVYGGLRGNSYVKREEPDYTFEQVCDWVDEMPNKDEQITAITNTMTETQLWKKLVGTSAQTEDEGKKKV